VAAVKAVYAQLGIAAKFEAYEAESHAKLSSTIEEQALLPKQVRAVVCFGWFYEWGGRGGRGGSAGEGSDAHTCKGKCTDAG
jgi:hypothetical protein